MCAYLLENLYKVFWWECSSHVIGGGNQMMLIYIPCVPILDKLEYLNLDQIKLHR